MQQHTKHKAWFLTGATILSGLIGALVDSGQVPPPYNGLVVAIGMFLSALIKPPAQPPEG